MTQLSNSNLLDENVSTNLKHERLKKTAQSAQNPNMDRSSQNSNASGNGSVDMNANPQPNVQMQQPVQPIVNPNFKTDYQSTGRVEREDNISKSNDDNVPNNLPRKDYGTKSNSSDDNKILGMKPALFYTLLGVTVIVGGYFAYKKFSKKGSGSSKVEKGGKGEGSASGTSASASAIETTVPKLEINV
jgi:hypothetical protein